MKLMFYFVLFHGETLIAPRLEARVLCSYPVSFIYSENQLILKTYLTT